ncbi:MAG: hypothetical protein ACRD0V_07200 [Acidimicrobiales bacterium]
MTPDDPPRHSAADVTMPTTPGSGRWFDPGVEGSADATAEVRAALLRFTDRDGLVTGPAEDVAAAVVDALVGNVAAVRQLLGLPLAC